jgi:hypothetical protein
MEHWVAHRWPGWEERSPGQPDATLAPIRNHITPKLGKVAVDRLRPVDVDNLYASWRADAMAEATVRRMHGILHAALTQAVRWDLLVPNPADRIEPPKPRKARRQAPSDELLQAILAAAGDVHDCPGPREGRNGGDGHESRGRPRPGPRPQVRRHPSSAP